jgi:hypothetical protein
MYVTADRDLARTRIGPTTLRRALRDLGAAGAARNAERAVNELRDAQRQVEVRLAGMARRGLPRAREPA